MGALLLLIGIFIFVYAYLKAKPWGLRIAGILLFLIGLGMLGNKEGTKTTQTINNQSSQVEKTAPTQQSTQSPQTTISKSTSQQQETKKEEGKQEEKKEDPKKENPKTFGKLEDFENKLQKMLGELNLYYTIKDAPLADGRPRKSYDAKFSSIDIIGSPEVEEVSVMFVPATSKEENIKTLAFILLPFNILCNQEGNKAKSEKFIDTLTQMMKNSLNRKSSKFTDKELTFPPCNVKILSGTRDFPLWVVTFRKI